jgi:hypothetical protein
MNGHGLRWLRLKRLLRPGDSTKTYDRRNYQGQFPSIAHTPPLRLAQCEGNPLFVMKRFFHGTFLSTGRQVCRIFSLDIGHAAHVF